MNRKEWKQTRKKGPGATVYKSGDKGTWRECTIISTISRGATVQTKRGIQWFPYQVLHLKKEPYTLKSKKALSKDKRKYTCIQCGKKFTKTYKNQKTCSKECSRLHRLLRDKERKRKGRNL